MNPLPTDQVHGAVQVLLTVIGDERASIAGNMVEGVVSAKSLLRGILGGQFVICAPTPPEKPKPQEPLEMTEAEDVEEAVNSVE